MLQVLLIGNGFDLAHKASTSFRQFALHLKKNFIIPNLIKGSKVSQKTFKDELFNIYDSHIIEVGAKKYSIRGVLDFSEERRTKVLMSNMDKLIPLLRNKFLTRLYIEEPDHWFDIENTYFRALVEIKNIFEKTSDISSKRNLLNNLNKLNQDFQEIKRLLKDYLSDLKIEHSNEIEAFFYNLIRPRIDVHNYFYIIDFNYTKTVLNYKLLQNHTKEYVPIHGTISDEIIFGYGNDKDEEYIAIKNLGQDEFLENFKTQNYLLNNHYQKIYNQLVKGSEPYDIHVLGHSLGTTDKTLLQEIFESDKCNFIHFYKRSDLIEQDSIVKVRRAYLKLSMAATRIIDDEIARIKITTLPNSKFFP